MIGSFDDFGFETRQNFRERVAKNRSLIGAVGKQLFEEWKLTEQRRQQYDAAIAILNASGMNDGVQQQTQRWLRANCFEHMAHDLRAVLRLAAGRNAAPSAAILDSRTLQSTPESGARAGFDGAKKRKGSKAHAAVDTLGHLLALKVTAANEQDRAQVGDLAKALQEATDGNVELAYADQGYTGEKPAAAATEHGLRLEVIKHHEAKRGFVLLPRRWVVERSFAWAARFRRLARDYERLASTLSGYHWLAFTSLMLHSLFPKSP